MRKDSDAEKFISQKFGRLTVTGLSSTDKFGNRRVNCTCDCGNEKVAVLRRLKNGETQSCGCLQIENANKQLIIASERNPFLKGKSEPRLATAKLVYRRYDDGNLSFDDFLILTQKNCFYCGVVPSNKTNYYITKKSKYSKERQLNGYFIYNGLDRVDNKLPHNIDNVVPCCITCNKAKLQRSKEEFLKWVETVYRLHCVGAAERSL